MPKIYSRLISLIMMTLVSLFLVNDITKSKTHAADVPLSVDIDATISLNCTGPVSLGTITGTGQATPATSTCTVVTGSSTGYQLTWQADTTGLVSDIYGDTIAAFDPGGVNPIRWDVGSTSTAWGAHLGSTSNVADTATWGSADAYNNDNSKWLNVDDAAPYTFIHKDTETDTDGDAEVLYFGTEIGSSVVQPSGHYTNIITITATTK